MFYSMFIYIFQVIMYILRVERIRFMGYYGSKLQLLWLLERGDVHEFIYKERQQFSKVFFNLIF